MPPCPGIKLDESFTPANLLNKLATASPSTEYKLVININKNNLIKGDSKDKETRADKKTGVITRAIANPSNVLFGLILGRNLFTPNRLPEK